MASSAAADYTGKEIGASRSSSRNHHNEMVKDSRPMAFRDALMSLTEKMRPLWRSSSTCTDANWMKDFSYSSMRPSTDVFCPPPLTLLKHCLSFQSFPLCSGQKRHTMRHT